MIVLVECHGITVPVGHGASRVVPIRGLDLTIGPGECVAVQGPSGSGKSTLLNAVAGLVQPSEGTVIVDGLPPGQAGANIGILYQNFRLVPFLTAHENVSFALESRGWNGREAWQRASDDLVAVGLETMKDRRPHELSGGEQQRVAIARAVAPRPRVILADEPTSALDQHTAHAVMTDLLKLVKDAGACLLVATHDARVAEMADRRLTLVGGVLHDED